MKLRYVSWLVYLSLFLSRLSSRVVTGRVNKKKAWAHTPQVSTILMQLTPCHARRPQHGFAFSSVTNHRCQPGRRVCHQTLLCYPGGYCPLTTVEGVKTILSTTSHHHHHHQETIHTQMYILRGFWISNVAVCRSGQGQRAGPSHY